MKRRKFKLIVPSILAIFVSVLLIAGTTFALFTSQVTNNLVVSSGKVDLKANLTDLHAYSAKAVDGDQGTAGYAEAFGVASYYDYVDATYDANEDIWTFSNTGTAKLTNNKTLDLVRMTAGDRVTLKLTLDNSETNVDILYRVRLNAISDNGLLDGLTVKVGTDTLNGVISVGPWTELLATDANPAPINLEVYLPVDAENKYQDKSAELRFTVEAVQANAAVDELLDLVNKSLRESEGMNPTMYAALQEVKANADFAAFDGTKYLWSPDTDQFYSPYTVEGLEVNFFKAYLQSEFNELTAQKYSVYATGEWTGISSTNPLNITVGFDAGEATGITNINYDRHDATTGQKVVIRTNGGSLTVNAPKDVVYHYGDVDSLNIIAVAGQSYHENGYVALVEIKNGRIVLEDNSEVGQIHLAATSGDFNDITIAKAPTVEMPAFSRDPVEIPEGGKLVVALQSSTEEEADKDYVWLTAIGIYEQVTVSDSSTNAGETYASEMTAQSTEEQQKVAAQKQAAQQIANNISVGLGTDTTYTVTAQKSETTGDWEYSLKGETEQATQEVADYTVTVEEVVEQEVKTTQVTVEKNQAPVVHTTTVQNGVTSDQKEAIVNEIESDIVRIGTKRYNDLQAAFDDANEGDTVYLLKDVELDDSSKDLEDFYKITKAFTFDGLNRKLTIIGNDPELDSEIFGVYSDGFVLKNIDLEFKDVFYGIYSQANMTLTNVKITSNNFCISEDEYYEEGLAPTIDCNNCEFVFAEDSGTKQTNHNNFNHAAVNVMYGGKINLNNCVISSDAVAISSWPSGGIVTATNCSISADEYAVWFEIGNGTDYTPDDSVANLNNCAIEGELHTGEWNNSNGSGHGAYIYVNGTLVSSWVPYLQKVTLDDVGWIMDENDPDNDIENDFIIEFSFDENNFIIKMFDKKSEEQYGETLRYNINNTSYKNINELLVEEDEYESSSVQWLLDFDEYYTPAFAMIYEDGIYRFKTDYSEHANPSIEVEFTPNKGFKIIQ